MMQHIKKIIEDTIQSGKIVGASVIIAKESDIVLETHAGFAKRELNQPVTENTLFRLASMTKPIVSAVALALVEKGILQLDAPITTWLPDFKPTLADGTSATITLRHLLTHTSGLSYGFLQVNNEPYSSYGISDGLDDSVLSIDENLKRLAKAPLLFEPGTRWHYSLATDVLGGLLEKACDQPLSTIVEEYVTKPLAMKNTAFYLDNIDNLARAYVDSDQEPRLMDLHDSVQLPDAGKILFTPCRVGMKNIYASGGAGLASTARDYLKFLEAIRMGGAPILTHASNEAFMRDAVHPLDVEIRGVGVGFSLGYFVIRDSKLANTLRPAGSVDFGSAYGCFSFVDPINAISAVMLVNTTLDEANLFTAKITEAIYA